MVKNLPAKASDTRDAGSIPRLERSPGGGHENPLQYSCLENPMDRGAWRATVHGVAKSWTQLKQLSRHTCMHMYVCVYILFSQLFPIIVCFNILNIDLCVTEKILVYLFYIGQCASVNSVHPTYTFHLSIW